jgi:shikimate dehydrogenase
MKHWLISGSTRLVGVFGDPVEHSVSPSMHNAAFESLELDYVYVPFRVDKADLGAAIAAVRTLKMRGVNVTVPHKIEIMPFLDEIDQLAAAIGAVNVVVNNEGHLTGYNTDAEGFLSALTRHGFEPEEQSVVVLGAGGAARAISFALAARGAHLAMLNRTIVNAAKCAADINEATGQSVEVLALNARNLADALERADLLVNATTVGMAPNPNYSLVTSHMIRPQLVVADIVYNPGKTKLLEQAEKAGARTIGGLDMLIRQGAMAFEKWTGIAAPIDIMKKGALRALKAHER